MITFPCAKINLGLDILRKRSDGFHDIQTAFYPIGLTDALEFVVSNGNKTTLRISGIQVNGNENDNLVMKAYRAVKKLHALPHLDICLRKNIPFGAGLGGGSSDAAFMIVMLNNFFHLHMNVQTMESIASSLGSDCPFFITSKPSFAEGRGELLTPLSLSLKGLYFTLVKPTDKVSTAEAYANCNNGIPSVSLREALNKPLEEWKGFVNNSFEPSVFPNHPTIESIKNKLYDLGAVYASMSGSGSSVFALSRQPLDAQKLFASCFVWEELF